MPLRIGTWDCPGAPSEATSGQARGSDFEVANGAPLDALPRGRDPMGLERSSNGHKEGTHITGGAHNGDVEIAGPIFGSSTMALSPETSSKQWDVEKAGLRPNILDISVSSETSSEH
eukprot:4866467-Pyramimonas_sp.AAC.1